jgi:Slime mold cyclic AMP receptor
VTPANYNDPDLLLLPTTGCSRPCGEIADYTHDEKQGFYIVTFVTSIFSFVSLSAFLYVWLTDKTRRKQTLIITFGVINLFRSLYTFCVYAAVLSNGAASVVCRDNAVHLTPSDGVTACSVQVIVLLYGSLSTYLTWMFIAFDVFLKVIYNEKYIDKYIHYVVATIILLPLIPTLILLIGFPQDALVDLPVSYCFMDTEAGLDLALIFYPLLAILCTGFSLMCAVIFHIAFINKGKDTFAAVRVPIMFVMLMVDIIILPTQRQIRRP